MSQRLDWETPQEVFGPLDKEFGFTLDAAADEQNTKVPGNFFSEEDDALTKDWKGVIWLNPPYGRVIGRFIKKAHDEAILHRATVVALVPARTDTSYWHDYIFGKAEVRFLRGRLKFLVGGEAKGPAPFPSAVVIWRGQNILP